MAERSLDIGPMDVPIGFTDSIDIDDLPELRRESELDQEASYGDFLQARAEDLPYPNSTFDKVNAGQVIGPYADLEESIREVYRVLKRGGLFTIRTEGKYVSDVYRLSKELGFTITKSERNHYEEEYNEDWIDMRQKKVGSNGGR